jgi:hypothetical protein
MKKRSGDYVPVLANPTGRLRLVNLKNEVRDSEADA